MTRRLLIASVTALHLVQLTAAFCSAGFTVCTNGYCCPVAFLCDLGPIPGTCYPPFGEIPSADPNGQVPDLDDPNLYPGDIDLLPEDPDNSDLYPGDIEPLPANPEGTIPVVDGSDGSGNQDGQDGQGESSTGSDPYPIDPTGTEPQDDTTTPVTPSYSYPPTPEPTTTDEPVEPTYPATPSEPSDPTTVVPPPNSDDNGDNSDNPVPVEPQPISSSTTVGAETTQQDAPPVVVTTTADDRIVVNTIFTIATAQNPSSTTPAGPVETGSAPNTRPHLAALVMALLGAVAYV